ncbi:MAG: glycosyltransferase family 2 protein [Bacteroidales bacterium]
MVTVSIIIPCYNQGVFIDEAVNSVLLQSFQDFEIIIINDGSTDPFTISKLKEHNWPKTKVIHTENHGVSAARNTGIRASNGEYIQFLDADDSIAYNKFERQLDLLRNASENALSYTDYFTASETDLSVSHKGRYQSPKFRSRNYLQELILNWELIFIITPNCFLFNSYFFKEKRISFNESLINHEDWECFMNIFALNPEVFYIDEKLAIYRIQSKGACSKKKLMYQGHLKALEIQLLKYKNNKKLYFLFLVKIFIIKYIKGLKLIISILLEKLKA